MADRLSIAERDIDQRGSSKSKKRSIEMAIINGVTMNDDIFATFPQLETERLVLRQFVPDDAEDIFRIFANPEVIRYWGAAPMASIEEAWGKIAGITAAFH